MNDVFQTHETIFGEAIEISSRQERSLFLDGACQGNAELRREVEDLLKIISEPVAFLSHLRLTW